LIGTLTCFDQTKTPCSFHHGSVRLTHPDGFVEILTTDLATASFGNPVTLTSTHLDTLMTSGSAIWHMEYGNPANPLPDAADGSWITGAGEVLGASTTCDQGLQVTNPKICVTKRCVFPAGQNCFPFGSPVMVAGTVTNCGDEELAGISVVDSGVCTITLPPGLVLAPGASANFTGTCTAQNNGCSHTDTVTAMATSTTTITAVTATSSPATVCPICNNPCVQVTKNCGPATINVGASYTVSGSVRNCGDIPLVNVVVVDHITDASGNTTTVNITIGDLAVGQTKPIPAQTISPTLCGPSRDQFTVTGTSVCGGAATPASSEVCTTQVICPPRIEVLKEVACATPTGCPASGYAKSATGVRDGECPAFCYRITVRNPALNPDGTPNLTPLVNITLTDPSLNLAACNAALAGVTLQPGQSATPCIAGPVEHCADFTNTVTARAQSALDASQSATDTDTATVRVLNINIACNLTLSSSSDMDNNPTDNHVTLLAGSVDTPITFNLTLRNTGTSPLNVTALNGLPSLVDCASGTPIVVALPIHLNAGASTTISGCVRVSCPPGAPFSVSAHAEADDQGGTVCVFDTQGRRIADDSPACVASVTCEALPPRLDVTKEVACLIAPNLCGPYGKSATGFKVVSSTTTNLPAFCYSITVSNSGTISLTNVTLIDDKFGDLTADFLPCVADVFAPGETCTFTFTTELEFDQINTVNATGRSVVNGQPASAQDSATGHVFQASIACNKQVSTNGVDFSDAVVIAQDSQNHTVFYKITVFNHSAPGVTLTNLQVADALLSGCNIASQIPASLPSGGSFSVVCALALNCSDLPGGQVRNTATVSAEFFSVGDTACTHGLDGRPIQVTSSCSALVACEGCQLIVTKRCLAPPSPPQPFPFVCSDAKPITMLLVQWNGAFTIYVRAWNGSIGTGTPSVFGPVAPGDKVTFTRSGTFPNDIYFELFTDPSLSAASKLGNSTFHLSCSDVDMNGPEDCGNAAGDGKGLLGFINQWIFVGMGGNGLLLDCFPTPASLQATNTVCDISPVPTPDCESQGKPTSLTFQYTGGGCAASSNPQSGKFICSGLIDPALPVTVATANGYTISPNVVSPGGTFTVSGGSFNAQSAFTLSNSGGTENLSIHTSCSQRLAVGDVFGSLTLVGFNGQTAGADVIYVYGVSNAGPQTAFGIVLTDDKLGPIAGPFNLPAFGSTNFQAAASISVTMTNVATASTGPGCEAQSNPVVVRVPETPPPLACPTEICSEFNDKKIAAGASVWFNAVVKVNHRDGKPGTVTFTGQRVKFTSDGVNYDLPAPDAAIIFSATAVQASTAFDTVANRWVTTVPVQYNGNVFIGGLAVPAPAGGFAKKLKPVCWSGGFGSDIGKLEFEWKWAAAVYSPFGADYNALGVKPIDNDKLNPYKNGDHAGTPENFKHSVTAGARGGGGSNFTGSYTGSERTVCGGETPALECTSGLVAFLVQYTGPDIAGPLSIKFVGSQSPATLVATYLLPGGLTTGTTLSLAMESDPSRPWTVDATKHNQTKLGTRTEVYFNDVLTEVFHTSCSCNQNNFIPGQPACLDATSPDNATGTKGYPSPLFLVLDFK
jgi:hypothetical protein